MPQPRQQKLWQQTLPAMRLPSRGGSSSSPGLGLGARHERLLLGWLHHGRGFLRVGLRLGLLERRDDRALGNSFVIGGVNYGIARADGLTCLVGDAAAVLFLVAIVNDLAACRRLDDGAFDLDSADRLAVRAYGKGEDCRRVSLSRDLAANDRDGRGRDALARSGRRCPGSCPYDSGMTSPLWSSAVVIGAVATGLDIAGYSLDNGVADVDVAARLRQGCGFWLAIAAENPPSASASTMEPFLMTMSSSSVMRAIVCQPPPVLARTVTVAWSSVMPLRP